MKLLELYGSTISVLYLQQYFRQLVMVRFNFVLFQFCSYVYAMIFLLVNF